MIITSTILDELTAKAKATPRLRANYDLRNSAEDEANRARVQEKQLGV